jgi:hypothetical protein
VIDGRARGRDRHQPVTVTAHDRRAVASPDQRARLIDDPLHEQRRIDVVEDQLAKIGFGHVFPCGPPSREGRPSSIHSDERHLVIPSAVFVQPSFANAPKLPSSLDRCSA